jgi:hypothetical protein
MSYKDDLITERNQIREQLKDKTISKDSRRPLWYKLMTRLDEIHKEIRKIEMRD